jgi:hypothetical protein
MAQSNSRVNIYINSEAANANLRDLTATSRRLKNELALLKPTSAEFIQKTAEFQLVQERLNKVNGAVKGTGGMFQWLKKEIGTVGIVGVFTAIGYAAQTYLSNIVSGNAKLSDSLADIRKTTGLTTEEVKTLNSQLGKIDTRTSAEELRKIAVVAGQLGISGQDVLAFTEATDKLVVALGDEFQGGAEEVTRVMGGLRNVFTDIRSDKVDEDMLHIGNAINELGATGSATGPVVADFANRIGGIGISMGLTSGQVLGLSATLQELNITAERGGTATTKILQKMAGDAEGFAKIAGVSVSDFKNLLDNDLFAAFTKVVEGSTKTATGAQSMAKMLKDAELQGAGASEIFAKLGSNTDLLSKRVSLANTALGNSNSILAEFGIKNETLGAQLEKIQKAMASAFTNSAILDGLTKIVGLFSDMIGTPLSEKMEEERISLLSMQIQINETNISQKDRIALIQKLQAQYPQYLGNLNAETVSNDDLNKAIEGVNKNLVNKIILQKQDEKVQEQAKQTADFLIDKLSKEKALRDNIATLRDKFAKGQELTGTLIEQANQLKTILQADNPNFLSAEQKGIVKLIQGITTVELSMGNFNHNNKEYNNLLAERAKLEKELGLSPVAVPAKDTNDKAKKPVSNYTSEADQKDIDKAKKKAEKLADELAKAQEKADAKRIEEAQKTAQRLTEIEDYYINTYNATIKDKFEREKALAVTSTAKQLEELDAKFLNEEQTAELKLRINQELADKLEAISDEQFKYEMGLGQKTIQFALDQAKIEEDIHVKKAERKVIEAQNDQDRFTATQELYGAQLVALQAQMASELANTELTENQKLLIKEDYANRTAELNAKMTEESKQQAINAVQNVGQYSLQIIGLIEQLSAARFRNDIANIDKSKNSRIKALEEQKNKGIITEDQFQKRKTIIEQNAARESYLRELNQFKLTQALSRVQILIQGALLAMQMSTQLTPYVGIPAAAIITGIQLAIVEEAQPPQPPQFAVGGQTLGRVDSRVSASAGGNFDTPFYGLIGEAGPEYVVPNWMLQKPQVANMVGLLEGIRTGNSTAMPQFAKGGSTGSDSGNSSGTGTLLVRNLKEEQMLLEIQNSLVKIERWPTQLKVYVSGYDIAEKLNENQKAKYPDGVNSNAFVFETKKVGFQSFDIPIGIKTELL